MRGKGLVERFHDYLERSFLPGREFTSPADFNAQLGAWTAKANTRWHRRLECRPADRIGADLARVRVSCDGRIVADHERCWAKHQTLTDPGHLQAAQALRSARRLAVVPVPRGDEVEQRDLAVYDLVSGSGEAV